DPAAAAELFFNTVCWSYVHLRGRHHGPAERARQGLRRLITPALEAVPGSGPLSARDHGGEGTNRVVIMTLVALEHPLSHDHKRSDPARRATAGWTDSGWRPGGAGG